jgi:hypothetical protein
MDESRSIVHKGALNFPPFLLQQNTAGPFSAVGFSDFNSVSRTVDVSPTLSSSNGDIPAGTTSNFCSSALQETAVVEDDLKMSMLLQQFDQALLMFATTSINGIGAGLSPDSAAIIAFRVASQIAPGLVKDLSFRKMFLRADSYDPISAAKRFMQFFQHKMEFFGVEKLGKKITISDLSDEDRNYLYDGRWQIAKERDVAGRVIFCTTVKQNEAAINESSMVSSRNR